MKNRNELQMTLNNMRNEFAEATLKGNRKLADSMVNEILRLELILKEEQVKRDMEIVENKLASEITVAIEKDEAYRQVDIVSFFNRTIKDIVKKYHGTSNTIVSKAQADTIMAGMRDRIGIDISKEQIDFINKLNFNQASEIIKFLRGISFYNQRVQITKAMEILKDNDRFAEALAEVHANIYKREWFELNQDLLRASSELEEPTEAQIRKIANVAKYIETHKTLESEFGIIVDNYEIRKEGKLQYTFNWNGLKQDIKARFNKESASNFIQTYDYITNIYEGNQLDKDQVNYIRGLYTQLGEYDCTKLTHIMTISKYYYDQITKDLESKVRLNKVANNLQTQNFRKKMQEDNTLVKFSAQTSREVRSLVLKEEQQQARELSSFVFNIYRTVGQEVPEEMSRILPYFIQGGECKYAGVEECHYQDFRRMVFEQRDVIKEVNPDFKWGAFVADQPTHVLKVLGLDIMM